jgi:hypothetical protein
VIEINKNVRKQLEPHTELGRGGILFDSWTRSRTEAHTSPIRPCCTWIASASPMQEIYYSREWIYMAMEPISRQRIEIRDIVPQLVAGGLRTPRSWRKERSGDQPSPTTCGHHMKEKTARGWEIARVLALATILADRHHLFSSTITASRSVWS